MGVLLRPAILDNPQQVRRKHHLLLRFGQSGPKFLSNAFEINGAPVSVPSAMLRPSSVNTRQP
jgi:hypothetical protein